MFFFRLDEGISYRIAEAARLIGVPQDLAFETPVHAGLTGEKDPIWIERLSQRGKAGDIRCVLSADRLSEPERAACESAKLVVFLVPGPRWWRELKHLSQAAYVLRWLPSMIEIAKALPAGSIVQLPASFAPRANLRPLKPVIVKRARKGPRPRKPIPNVETLFNRPREKQPAG